MGMELSRREMMAATLGSAALVLGSRAMAGAAPDPSLARALADAAPKHPGSDLGAIKHIVFIMMENRSFDQMYGSLSGVRGFDDRTHGAARTFRQKLPRKQGGHVLPYRYNTDRQDATCTVSPEHLWGPMHAAWNGGRLNFVRSQIKAQPVDPQVTGPMTMGYYNRKDLPYYYSLADAFTICDDYYSSVIGPTHPNRVYAISGTLDPDGRAGGPCLTTTPANFSRFSWVTAPELLEDAGVSWKMYNPPGPWYDPANGLRIMLASNNTLLMFKQFMTPGTTLYKKAFAPQWPNDFVADVENNRLPKVSWVYPGAFPGYDEHPSAPVSRGEWGTNKVLRSLFRNPKVWANTLVVHTYDENGAYFDHVKPPVPRPGTRGEYVTVDPLPPEAEGVAGPIGLGFRVPTMIISPWSRGGYVSHDRFDHVSMLLLLEQRYGIRFHNISRWRRREVGDLTSTLRLDDKCTTVPRLPRAPRQTAKIEELCEPLNLGKEVGGSEIPYPQHQRMPRQERGRRPVVS